MAMSFVHAAAVHLRMELKHMRTRSVSYRLVAWPQQFSRKIVSTCSSSQLTRKMTSRIVPQTGRLFIMGFRHSKRTFWVFRRMRSTRTCAVEYLHGVSFSTSVARVTTSTTSEMALQSFRDGFAVLYNASHWVTKLILRPIEHLHLDALFSYIPGRV